MHIFENVCTEEFLMEIQEDLSIKLKQSLPDHISSVSHWDASLLVGIEGKSTQITIDNHISKKMRNIIIKKVPEVYQCNMAMSYQIMPYKSGISKHSDGNKKFGATLYLNKHWDIDYGGLLIYEDDGLKALCPKYNTLMINTPKHLHLVTAVTNAAPESRITLQIFGV